MDTRQLVGVLRRGRAAKLLAGGRAARGDPAGRQPPDAGAREAARDAAPRPLGAPRRADRGGNAALPRRAAAARARGAGRRRGRRGGDRRARGHVRDRRLDRPGRDRALPPPLRVPGRSIPSCTSCSGSSTRRRSSSAWRRASSSWASSGAARRHRGVVFEPFFHDEVDPRLPARPSLRRQDGRTRRAARRRADRDAGRRRRPAVDRGRAAAGRDRACAISTSRLELGLQESVTSAVRAGYGVTFISRSSIESDLAAGTLAEAQVEGLELEARDLPRPGERPGRDARPRARSSISPATGCT